MLYTYIFTLQLELENMFSKIAPNDISISMKREKTGVTPGKSDEITL